MSRVLAANAVVGLIMAIAMLPLLLPMRGGLGVITVFIGPIAAGLAGGAISRSGRAVFANVAVALAVTVLGMWVGGTIDRQGLVLAAGVIATLVAMGHFTALAVRRPVVLT